MQAWIAVSSQENHVNDYPKYWCFSKQAEPDDLVFVYLTKKCSIAGIRHICKVNQVTEPHSECVKRRMITRKLNGVLTISNPISYQELIEHPVLSEMDGVYGRFQKTTIKITRDYILEELLKLIAEKSPDSKDEIKEITKAAHFV